VGNDYDVTHHRYPTLIESMSGTTWTVNTSPSPGAIGNGLNGVSCPSTTSCEAVGGYNSALGVSRTLVEHWNGSSWALATSPNHNSLANSLQGVSCATTTRCETVGFYSAPLGAEWALSEKLIGTTWSLSSGANNGTQDNLLGVSCVSSVNCKSTGNYYNAGLTANQTLIEIWNGTSSSLM
jgi:hypothetical protein